MVVGAATVEVGVAGLVVGAVDTTGRVTVEGTDGVFVVGGGSVDATTVSGGSVAATAGCLAGDDVVTRVLDGATVEGTSRLSVLALLLLPPFTTSTTASAPNTSAIATNALAHVGNALRWV